MSGKSSVATTTLLVVMILVLGVAVMYLLTRIRKQDNNIDKMRKENQQQLQDEDIVQITKAYLQSPEHLQSVHNTIGGLVQYYANAHYQQLQNYLQQQQQQTCPILPKQEKPSEQQPPPQSEQDQSKELTPPEVKQDNN